MPRIFLPIPTSSSLCAFFVMRFYQVPWQSASTQFSWHIKGVWRAAQNHFIGYLLPILRTSCVGIATKYAFKDRNAEERKAVNSWTPKTNYAKPYDRKSLHKSKPTRKCVVRRVENAYSVRQHFNLFWPSRQAQGFMLRLQHVHASNASSDSMAKNIKKWI